MEKMNAKPWEVGRVRMEMAESIITTEERQGKKIQKGNW